MSPVFSVRVSKRQHSQLANAPVPAPAAAVGIRRFGVDASSRYAVIVYLRQDAALPSITPGTRDAGAWLQVSLPDDLHRALEARASAEGRSKSSIIRAAIDLAFPLLCEECAGGLPTTEDVTR